MNENFTSKGMIRDITAQRSFAKQLIGRGKDYDKLLELLLEEDYYYDDDIMFPSTKELTEKLRISYSVFKRQISQVYSDLSEIYTNNIDYTINDVEYIFGLKFLGNWASVELKNIPAPPRVGEEVDIPFFKEKIKTTRFYVKSVDHEFTDQKQIIHIGLEPGSYNHYWNLFKDEEYLKGRMSRDDYFTSDENEVRKKYGFRWI